MISQENGVNRIEEAYAYALERKSFSKVSLVEQAEHVCVFGLGTYFREAFFVQNVKERFGVDCLCDNRKESLEKWAQVEELKGMHFVLPDDLKQMENVVVIFMLGDPRSAMAQLEPIVGIENCITYNDLILDDIMDAKKSLDFYRRERENVLKAFELLQDERSKEIFTEILCLRIAPHLAKSSYEDICTKPQYFPEGVYTLSEHENVVDCGAYDGDTLREFYTLVDGKFDHYTAFEIDKTNFTALKKCSEELSEALSEDKITCYPYGVWSENKNLSYGTMSSADSYSIFNGSETETAKVVKLDDSMKGKKVSLVKMDIEGSEMEALKGCEDIIKEQTPKMAICVYHRVEDLWQVPLYLKSLNSGYEIYMRHHAEYWVSETVCYAIPEE